MSFLDQSICRGIKLKRQLTELGSVLSSMIGLIPDGVVVFLPSYSFLEKVKAFWAKSGLMARLGDRKEVS